MSPEAPIVSTPQPFGDGVCLALSGEIDLSRSPELRTALLQAATAKPARLVLDMSGVTYMDSSGVATLVEALQKINAGGGKLVLCGLQPKVKSIFQIAKLDTIFAIVDDTEAAKSA